MRLRLAALLLALAPAAPAQELAVSARSDAVSLAREWRFSAGDDPAFARPDYDDSGWSRIAVPTGWGPRGYHGPCVAAPGYSMYYLNVLAGPTPGRSMAFCDDPAHHWVRDTWEGMPVDPRCPMTSAEGAVHA